MDKNFFAPTAPVEPTERNTIPNPVCTAELLKTHEIAMIMPEKNTIAFDASVPFRPNKK
jgi:hypothetical protein